jgi:uncharacterized protein YdeI (BOF family)
MIFRNIKNKRSVAHISGLSAAIAVCMAPLSGCGSRQETTRGTALPAVAVSTVAQLAHIERARPVLLHGEMVDKCPMAGCWFMLRDKTGIVRVDTKAAGFVVSDVPLHTTLTVAGKVTPGTQPGVAATGIRF